MEKMTVENINRVHLLNWFDLEVETNERENKTLQILYQIIKCTQSISISVIKAAELTLAFV